MYSHLLSYRRYSSEFSYHLARCTYALLKNKHSQTAVPGLEKKRAETASESFESRTKTKKIGFVCSPTAYVAFRYLYPETSRQTDEGENGMKIESYLFDYDERFSILTPPHYTLPTANKSDRFVLYDLNKSLVLPSSLEKQLDMVIIDPPYLNAETNLKIAQSVQKLLKSEEESKVLLITGQSIAERACEIYGKKTAGPLRRAEKLEVEHVDLKNAFGAWGNWHGVENFGVLEEYAGGQSL